MLARARQNAGLSQKEVATALKLTSPQYISNIERGLCMASPRVLRKMAALYHVEYKPLAQDLIRRSMYQRHHRLKERYGCL